MGDLSTAEWAGIAGALFAARYGLCTLDGAPKPYAAEGGVATGTDLCCCWRSPPSVDAGSQCGWWARTNGAGDLGARWWRGGRLCCELSEAGRGGDSRGHLHGRRLAASEGVIACKDVRGDFYYWSLDGHREIVRKPWWRKESSHTICALALQLGIRAPTWPRSSRSRGRCRSARLRCSPTRRFRRPRLLRIPRPSLPSEPQAGSDGAPGGVHPLSSASLAAFQALVLPDDALCFERA
jgi:hypothetical protein